jgi:hypothetical protein
MSMNTDRRERCVIVSLRRWLALLICGPLLPVAGCASAVATGSNTALSGADLQAITDDMAAKIVADQEVQAAISERGRLKVVVEPVENQMTAEILPRGPSEAFTARIRVLLSRHAPDRFTWVMNRDAYYRLRSQELDVDLGPSPEAISPEYALIGRISSLTDETRKGRSAYYLASFDLTNLQDRTVLWTGSYEVSKSAVRGMLD